MMNEEIVVAGLPLQFPKPTAGNQLPTLAEWNQRYIEYVLAFTKGKKTAAARILGINRRTLYRRKKAKANQNQPGLMDDAASFMDDTLTGVPAGHQVQ
jgi:DNA invertase Pin-like site-specific DNA recombinase